MLFNAIAPMNIGTGKRCGIARDKKRPMPTRNGDSIQEIRISIKLPHKEIKGKFRAIASRKYHAYCIYGHLFIELGNARQNRK